MKEQLMSFDLTILGINASIFDCKQQIKNQKSLIVILKSIIIAFKAPQK